MMNLTQIKKNPQVEEFIKQSKISLAIEGYTDHGLSHLDLVADRAGQTIIISEPCFSIRFSRMIFPFKTFL